jgi:hypothetical protein
MLFYKLFENKSITVAWSSCSKSCLFFPLLYLSIQCPIRSLTILPNSLLNVLVTEIARYLSQFFLSPCLKMDIKCAIFHSLVLYVYLCILWIAVFSFYKGSEGFSWSVRPEYFTIQLLYEALVFSLLLPSNYNVSKSHRHTSKQQETQN